MPSPLVYDLIARILELFSTDYDLLSRCALVNWEFNRAASRLLYARVVIAPKFSVALDLKDTTGIPQNTNFLSACLPRNAPHVLSLEVKGYTSQRPPGPRNTLSTTLAEAIPLFVNLKRIRFAPVTFHEDLFLPVLPELVKLQNQLRKPSNASKADFEHPQAPTNSCESAPARSASPSQSTVASMSAPASNPAPNSSSGITNLTVNQSCMTVKPVPSDADEDYVETGTALSLVQLDGLRKLTLINPGRAILHLLPDWLAWLKTSLVELHLKDNCGSITPGVLKSFLPLISESVQAFTLGLSYSLTDADVFGVLTQLPHLRRVNLRYYWQMRIPAHQPPLPTLRSFTATYPMLASAKEVRDFGKWVRRALASSPKLEVLRLRREGEGSSGMNDDEEEEEDGDGGGGGGGGGGGIDLFGRTVHSFLTGSDEGRVRARSKENAEGDGEDGGDGEAEVQQNDSPQGAETDDDHPPPSHRVAHTGLMDHILQKHARTIRVLDLGEALVSVRQLRQVMERCESLEELKCVLGKQALAVFTETLQASASASAVLPRLRRVSFQVSDLKRGVRSNELKPLARKILCQSEDETGEENAILSPVHQSLRRVQLNSLKWEAVFVVDHRTKASKYVVCRVQEVHAPWERTRNK